MVYLLRNNLLRMILEQHLRSRMSKPLKMTQDSCIYTLRFTTLWPYTHHIVMTKWTRFFHVSPPFTTCYSMVDICPGDIFYHVVASIPPRRGGYKFDPWLNLRWFSQNRNILSSQLQTSITFSYKIRFRWSLYPHICL